MNMRAVTHKRPMRASEPAHPRVPKKTSGESLTSTPIQGGEASRNVRHPSSLASLSIPETRRYCASLRVVVKPVYSKRANVLKTTGRFVRAENPETTTGMFVRAKNPKTTSRKNRASHPQRVNPGDHAIKQPMNTCSPIPLSEPRKTYTP